MKILSINISEPKKIIFNGKELITSIYKKPIDGLVNVGDVGIDGDLQADLKVHGGYDKAIYAYSFQHYKFWSEKLNQDFNDFGLVGENLTIDDFNEKDLNIGDEISIGSCLLQISQPRIPCYKVGIKMNNRDFPKIFSQSCLLGSYLRVLETGKFKPGDEVEISKREKNSMSIYDISDILFNDLKNIDKMKKALDLKFLTEEIKERFRERLMKLGDFSSL
tara:strand:+ start:169 stop:828 length:660 start_codon:yes stop_codon:yes gene_type:complete